MNNQANESNKVCVFYMHPYSTDEQQYLDADICGSAYVGEMNFNTCLTAMLSYIDYYVK